MAGGGPANSGQSINDWIVPGSIPAPSSTGLGGSGGLQPGVGADTDLGVVGTAADPYVSAQGWMPTTSVSAGDTAMVNQYPSEDGLSGARLGGTGDGQGNGDPYRHPNAARS